MLITDSSVGNFGIQPGEKANPYILLTPRPGEQRCSSSRRSVFCVAVDGKISAFKFG
jgi:hypothetical protein